MAARLSTESPNVPHLPTQRKGPPQGGKLTRGEAGGPCCCGRPKDIVGPCYARGRCSFQTTFGGPYALHVESAHFKFSTKDAAFKISTHTLQGKDIVAPGSTSGGSTLPYWASTAEKWLINFYGYDSGDTKLNSGGTAYKTRILARLWIDISDDDTLEPDFQLELKTYAQGTNPTTGLPTNDVLTVTATETATIAGNCAGVFKPWPGVMPDYDPWPGGTPPTPGVTDAVENDWITDWTHLDIPADSSGYSPWATKVFAPVDVDFGKFGMAVNNGCSCTGPYIYFEEVPGEPNPDYDPETDDEDEAYLPYTYEVRPPETPTTCVVKFTGNKPCPCQAGASQGSFKYDFELPADVTCTLQIPEYDGDERSTPTWFGYAVVPPMYYTTYTGTNTNCSGAGNIAPAYTGTDISPIIVVYVQRFDGNSEERVFARPGYRHNPSGSIHHAGTDYRGNPYFFYSSKACHVPGLRVANQINCGPHYAGGASSSGYGGYAEVIFDGEDNDFP